MRNALRIQHGLVVTDEVAREAGALVTASAVGLTAERVAIKMLSKDHVLRRVSVKVSHIPRH